MTPRLYWSTLGPIELALGLDLLRGHVQGRAEDGLVVGQLLAAVLQRRALAPDARERPHVASGLLSGNRW